MAQPRYQVIERIDAGGMAEVFKANSTSLQGFQKLVAIKRILPNLTQNQRFIRMFLDEAKVSLHLNHNNTVHVFDLGIADGTYFIVMEYVDGTNLKNVIEHLNQEGKTLPIEQAVFIAIEVCKGLTHAHEKRDQDGRPLDIVHRDVSPPNVLISRAGEVKLTDFGLAKAKSQAEITDPGVVKGKFGYLSPEAAHGEDVDLRTDIFAVGILLWEMLTGRRLFLGDTDYQTLEQVRAARTRPVSSIRPDIPPELDQLLARALERDTDKRFQTAQSFAQALAQFLFRYGRVVTNYDLAPHVTGYLEKRGQRRRTEREVAVDDAVQRELNQIVSLEQIGDLDTYLAEHYDAMPDEGSGELIDSNGNFEDPRMWSGLGFASPADNPHSPQYSPQMAVNSGSDQWQEADLDELLRATPVPVKAPAAATATATARPAPSAATSHARQPVVPQQPVAPVQQPAQQPATGQRASAAVQPAIVGAPQAIAQVDSDKPRSGASASTIITIAAVLMILAAALYYLMGPGA